MNELGRSRPYEDAPRLPDGAIDLRSLVPGEGAIEVEIGPGRGAFVRERLIAAPSVRLIGFEVRRKWAKLVDDRLQRDKLSARVFAEDAKLVLPRCGPDASVQTVFLNFPDPWWKKRHEKRLVFTHALVVEVVRLLRSGGELFLQTDVQDRADRYERLVVAFAELVPRGDEPMSPRLAHNPYGAMSNREKRAHADGLPVYRLRWKKV